MATTTTHDTYQTQTVATLTCVYIPPSSDPPTTITLDSHQQLGGDLFPQLLSPLLGRVEITPLLRFSDTNNYAIYAYGDEESKIGGDPLPNPSATAIAMMCGLHATKFYGPIYIGKVVRGGTTRNEDFTVEDVSFQPDLRAGFSDPVTTPDWLYEAARINYSYAGSLSSLRKVMSRREDDGDDGDGDDDDDEGEDKSEEEDDEEDDNSFSGPPSPSSPPPPPPTKKTLCLQCRKVRLAQCLYLYWHNACTLLRMLTLLQLSSLVARPLVTLPLIAHSQPSNSLCSHCSGVYFCSASCKSSSWSHFCLCQTWKKYTARRASLSSFPSLDFAPLTTSPPFTTSDQPYRDFLNALKLYRKG